MVCGSFGIELEALLLLLRLYIILQVVHPPPPFLFLDAFLSFIAVFVLHAWRKSGQPTRLLAMNSSSMTGIPVASN